MNSNIDIVIIYKLYMDSSFLVEKALASCHVKDYGQYINCTDSVSSLSIVSHDAADLTNSYQLVYVLAWHGKDLLPYLLPRQCFHFLPF